MPQKDWDDSIIGEGDSLNEEGHIDIDKFTSEEYYTPEKMSKQVVGTSKDRDKTTQELWEEEDNNKRLRNPSRKKIESEEHNRKEEKEAENSRGDFRGAKKTVNNGKKEEVLEK